MAKQTSNIPVASKHQSSSPPPIPSEDELDEMLATKVPFSSRITLAAQRELAAIARERRVSTVQLLAEGLNLLFKAHGRKPVA